MLARHFHDVVRKMPKGALTLSMSGSQCEVRYADGKGWSRFPAQPGRRVPARARAKGDMRVTLEGEVLARMIERSAYATSTEPARPQLNGVYVHGNDKFIAFVATDGHRLARTSRKGRLRRALEGRHHRPEPRAELGREVRGTKPRARSRCASPTPATIGFATQVGEYQVQVYGRLIEGQYPNYEQVIPKDNPRELIMARTDVIEAVDIVASHADSNTQQIRFSLRDGKFSVSSATADFGAGEQSVEAEYRARTWRSGTTRSTCSRSCAASRRNR